MRHRTYIVAALLSAAALTRATAADEAKPSYPAVPLLSIGTNVVGETIRYPEGPAYVTAAIVTLAPGGRTILHKHGVPLFAYILDGTLTVNYGTHGTRTYHTSEAFMEAMDVAHYGINEGTQPVRILAVYMGATGAKNVIPVKQ